MNGKHTPGPWWWDYHDEDGNEVRTDPGGLGHGLVSEAGGLAVYFESVRVPDETALANKRLIAAAPELLEMLRRLEWHTGDGGEGTPLDWCGICGGMLMHRPACELAALLARLPRIEKGCEGG